MDSKHYYMLGNEAFVREKYLDAINFYSTSLAADSHRDCDVLLSRCHAFIKVEKYAEAKKDALEVILRTPNYAKARLRYGIASFHLGLYVEAKESFEIGLQLDSSDLGVKQWIQWCEEKMKKMEARGINEEPSANKIPFPATRSNSNPTSTPEHQDNNKSSQVTHGWYQTASSVIVEVRIKNLVGEDLKIEFNPTSFCFTAKLSSGNEYFRKFHLCHPIDKDQSTFRILSTKVEINLKKAEGSHWPQLEGTGKSAIPSVVLSDAIKNVPPSYPTSSGKDWSKIEKELSKEGEEKLEGDAELNELFKKIYQGGNDEVKKAMNKSFSESGGTVLSTNWTDIKKDQVDVKPPEGMEFKSWDN